MKVNENISAVISNANLHRTENSLTASIERLSSGYKINAAKDNPSGMAISNKMRAQIKALNQSSDNANDGISVLQTADGALNETHAILQRMRELAVQAATDSMTPADKAACQAEIEQLQSEIDRISNDTEFNSKSLLEGSQDRRIYPSEDGVENFQSTDKVAKGDYVFTIDQLPEQATLSFGPVNTGDTVSIGGYTVEITASDAQGIMGQLRDTCESVGMTLEMDGSAYKITTVGYGTKEKIEVEVKSGASVQKYDAQGKDTKLTLLATDDGFTNTASVTTDGTKVTVTDKDGFEMIFKVNPENMDKTAGTPPMPINPGQVTLEVTDIGTMDLQVGAHEGQEIPVRIPAVTTQSLYIDTLNLVRRGGADMAIAAIDEAIAEVSEVRSRIGAYQNRLEYAISSLDETSEDMEAAISRIQDTDMAEEMAEYSNLNVLNQAGISVLTQANDMPQQVLQLLH